MDHTGRQRAILDLVRDEEVTRVTALAERLGVSDETIRRNLKALVDGGVLTRRHGGVALSDAVIDAPFSRRLRVNAAAKKAAAEKVARHVEDGQVIMIDTGSTTAYVAQAIAQRRGLTIVTNSLEIARRLIGRNDNRIYIAGGEVRPDLAATVGGDAEQFIRRFHADLAILSMGGIEPRAGFADFDLDEARIARAMIDRSDARLVVADSSKFGRRAPVTVCEPGEIRAVCAEAGPSGATADWLRSAGVEISA